MKNDTKLTKIIMGVLIFTLLALLVSNCNGKKRDKKTAKTLLTQDSLIRILIKRPTPLTADEVQIITHEESTTAMYQFLIYEDDLDKGKISLSQIRENLNKND